MKEYKPINNRDQLTDAKEAIKKSIGRHEGKLDVKEDPKIAIEVLDDEIKGYRLLNRRSSPNIFSAKPLKNL